MGKEALSLNVKHKMWFEEKTVGKFSQKDLGLHRDTLLQVTRWSGDCLQGNLGRLKPRVLRTVIKLRFKS